MTKETIVFTGEVDVDALRSSIECVEENNDINGASWTDWRDADHVAQTYYVSLCSEGRDVIERAIETSGASLKVDLPAVELAVWGQNFSGSFWDRS